MGTIMNLAGKWLGLDQGVEKLEMGKAYLGGIGMMLSGVSTILGAIVGFSVEVMPLHDIAAYVGWVKSLGHDNNTGLMLAGAALFSKGLADIGNRHATAKLDAHMTQLATDPGPIVVNPKQGA